MPAKLSAPTLTDAGSLAFMQLAGFLQGRIAARLELADQPHLSMDERSRHLRRAEELRRGEAS